VSYYVRLEIAWDDGEGFDATSKEARDRVFTHVEAYLRGQEAAGREGRLDWLEEFRDAFACKGDVSIKLLDQRWMADLLCHVSARLPDVEFWARGIGEEFTDVWVIEVCAGQVQWAASLEGERQGAPRVAREMPPWPQPLEVARVVGEAGLIQSLGRILGGQPPTAEEGAVVLNRRGQRKPRALVYVGPLTSEGYSRIKDLVEPTYRPQLYRDASKLLSYPVATAENPLGH
jgi:hypothetical protein